MLAVFVPAATPDSCGVRVRLVEVHVLDSSCQTVTAVGMRSSGLRGPTAPTVHPRLSPDLLRPEHRPGVLIGIVPADRCKTPFRARFMPIQWSEEFSTGSSEIDTQHRRLFDMLNDLECRLAANESPKSMTDIVDGLARYAVEHFSYEEGCMEKCACRWPRSTSCAQAIRPHGQPDARRIRDQPAGSRNIPAAASRDRRLAREPCLQDRYIIAIVFGCCLSIGYE